MSQFKDREFLWINCDQGFDVFRFTFVRTRVGLEIAYLALEEVSTTGELQTWYLGIRRLSTDPLEFVISSEEDGDDEDWSEDRRVFFTTDEQQQHQGPSQGGESRTVIFTD